MDPDFSLTKKNPVYICPSKLSPTSRYGSTKMIVHTFSAVTHGAHLCKGYRKDEAVAFVKIKQPVYLNEQPDSSLSAVSVLPLTQIFVTA